MANDKSHKDNIITSTELDYILEVNRKSIQIHTEVAHQNEDILDKLDKLTTKMESIEKLSEESNKTLVGPQKMEERVENIDKNLFRLMILLGSMGIGLIIEIIKLLAHH